MNKIHKRMGSRPPLSVKIQCVWIVAIAAFIVPYHLPREIRDVDEQQVNDLSQYDLVMELPKEDLTHVQKVCFRGDPMHRHEGCLVPLNDHVLLLIYEEGDVCVLEHLRKSAEYGTKHTEELTRC
jgi:hypothetical protein